MTTEAVTKLETVGAPQHSGAWTRERVELVRRTICPRGIGDDEFALFIEQCKRSGLDPLLKEAFCVARKQNTGSRERPNWTTKYEFQPSEAGMLARAERFPDFKGIQASAVYAEDEIIVDQGKGEVVHRFNPAKRKGSLAGAWARVVREDKLPIVVWLDFAGYVQQSPLWSKIPMTMIEKCARVAALRKAYPEAFGGLYVGEEMPADEFVESAAHDGPAEAGKSYEALGTVPGPVKASFPHPVVAAAASTEQLSLTKAESPIVGFGPHKGRSAGELSDSQLTETLALAREKLSEQPRAKWAKAMKENLAFLEKEAAQRDRVPAPAEAEGPTAHS